MRKPNFLLLLAGLFLAAACDDSKDEGVVVPDLDPILPGHDWKETPYPLVMQDGQPGGAQGKSLSDLQEAVGIENQKTYPTFDEDLGVFYMRGDGVIRKYTVYDGQETKSLSNAYTYKYDPTAQVLLLTATRDKLRNGWFADAELKPVSVEEDRVVFEAPVREYTREELGLGAETVGLQTIWNLIENPKDASRYGTDLTDCDPLTGY